MDRKTGAKLPDRFLAEWANNAEKGKIFQIFNPRWFNHLSPFINKSRWTEQEDEIILEAHSKYGNKWSLIAQHLQGRSDNSIKNHWNSTLKRKIQNNE